METVWIDTEEITVSLTNLSNEMFELFQLKSAWLWCRTVKPPHVAESPFSMECELMHWYDVISGSGEPSNTVILGRVKRFHVVCH